MPLTPENRKQLLEYIIKVKTKKYPDEQIVAMLQKAGYRDEDIQTLPLKYPVKPFGKQTEQHLLKGHRTWVIAVCSILGIIILTILMLMLTPRTLCNTPLECFLEKANICEQAVYDVTYGTSTLTVEAAASCTLKKSFTVIDSAEPAAVRDILQGKIMECSYSKGSLTAEAVTQLTYDLQKCEGDLVNAIASLQ